jgi:dipeptidyl aminopeptidase/acylaminoacyl peptidase
VTSQTPPKFVIRSQSNNDRVGAENSVYLYLALKRAGVPTELHIYATGGHGYGLRSSDQPYSIWPQRYEEWLRARGFLKPGAKR